MDKTVEEILAIAPDQRSQEEIDALYASTELTDEQRKQLADEEAAASLALGGALTTAEILAKKPEERTEEEIAQLEDATDLTDEQIQQLSDEETAAGAPIETPEQKAQREAAEAKERQKQSANEKRIVREQNTILQERLAEVKEIPEPTDAELREYEPEYDELTDAQKRMTKRLWKSDKRAEQMHAIAIATKSDQEWNKKLDEFIDVADAEDKYPEIVKNRQEFIKFATQKQHKGVPVDILADAFYTRQGMQKPTPKRANLMGRSGTGGRTPIVVQKQKDTKLTPDQAKRLREKDPTKWLQLAKSGRIANDLSDL